MKQDENKSSVRRRTVNKPVCANCFACKKDTELCPLNENYSPDAYLKWEQKYLQNRKEKGPAG
ncbi:MAG: hypothetical protein ROZ36_19635 [Thermincola sp.]|nr:hypothetical protein [Thermincola sp.]